jgi:hypothetical protein
MTTNRSIQFKAAFLLVVFSLNTLVGFACSVGLKMGSGNSHHGNQTEGEVHIHKDGKKHVHKPVAKNNHDKEESKVHIHKDGKKHVHQPVTEKNHHDQGSADPKKDDCCKEKVVKIQTADKSFHFAKTSISAPIYIVAGNYIAPVTFKAVQPDLQEYIACHFHPPPRNIRVDIQSFQL